MERNEILSKVDHTLLAQTATWDEIKAICDDGMKYGCASVCIPASYVKQAAEYVAGKLPVCTVIGFPNGYDTTAAKCFMATDAVNNGAEEVDMVINLGWVKEGQYDKINGAASMGGMKEYIKTVERYYKIQIDNYAVVNFASFPKIIDSLDGVTITITDREINEINNHPKRYGDVYIEKSYEGTEGKQKLNGKQALAYCRIRKIDTDNARADRQKTVLLQVFKKMKGSSTTELLKVVNDLVGYVYTGYSKKELVSLATYALSDGWMNYETQTFSVPTPDHARGGNYLIGPTQLTPCGPSRGVWLWKSDIPQDAYDLQMKIYGKSNIKLAENRCDYCNLL